MDMRKFVEDRVKVLRRGGKLNKKQKDKLAELTNQFKKRIFGGELVSVAGAMYPRDNSRPDVYNMPHGKDREGHLLGRALAEFSYERDPMFKAGELVAGMSMKEISNQVDDLVKASKGRTKQKGLGLEDDIMKMITRTTKKAKGGSLEDDISDLIYGTTKKATDLAKKEVRKVAGKKKRAPSKYNKFCSAVMKKGYTMADAAEMWNQMKK